MRAPTASRKRGWHSLTLRPSETAAYSLTAKGLKRVWVS
jgi:hypothetical protein